MAPAVDEEVRYALVNYDAPGNCTTRSEWLMAREIAALRAQYAELHAAVLEWMYADSAAHEAAAFAKLRVLTSNTTREPPERQP